MPHRRAFTLVEPWSAAACRRLESGAMAPHSKAFTLVELLVVVTIIVILIAMLVPATERALYQANLTMCLTNLKSIGGGAIMYATTNKSFYPDRPTLRGGYWRRHNEIYDNGNDDRPYLKGYIAHKSLVDPMSGQIDLDKPGAITYLFPNYELWFGAKFASSPGFYRSTERLTFGGNSFRVLASDEDKNWQGGGVTHCSHPDKLGRQAFYNESAPDWVLSRYERPSVAPRGPIDAQHAFTDGSALRFNDVDFDDTERMGRVPIVTTGGDIVTNWSHVPRN